jgi:hypothetical protein
MQGQLFQSKAAHERVWTSFMAGHGSNHSAGAHTLAAIINRCEEEGIAYTLIAFPGEGYYIKRGSFGEKA